MAPAATHGGVSGSAGTLACRVASYRPHEDLAYAHLAALGVRGVEIRVPPAEQLDATGVALAAHGLRATTLHAQFDVARAGAGEQIRAQLPAFARLGTKIALLCVRHGDTPLDTVYGRLREAGDAAREGGVTLAIETHPDIAHNSDVWLATMRAVDHSHVRLNYDTANVYFYNERCDGLREIERVAETVAAVHVKDTNGLYRAWHFPALGRGVVDFRGTFEALDRAGFRGPLTLEIEGIEGEEKTPALLRERMAESVGFMRGLGRGG